jgi:hypothetical protein
MNAYPSAFALKELDKIKPFVDDIFSEFAAVVEGDLLERYGLSKSVP